MVHLQLQSLITLQKSDSEIVELEKLLAMIPQQLESAQKDLDDKKGKLKVLLDEIESLKTSRKKFEQDVQEESEHMAKTKTKLPAVKTNKEYTAILHEIDAIKKKVGGIEDQELEVMEQLEEKEAQIPELEAEFKGEEQQFQEYKKNKEAELERLQQERGVALKKQEEMAQAIDPELVMTYNKIKKMCGDDLAVVPLLGDNCQGCHHQIQPQVALEVRANEKIHQCQFCNRFLYSIPEPKKETETETAVSK